MIIFVAILFQSGDNNRKIDDIKEAIALGVLHTCNCHVFSSQYLVDANLTCEINTNGNNEFIFIANVLSTGEINSTYLRDEYVQQYILKGESVAVDGLPFAINEYCSSNVIGEGNTRCLSYGDPTVGPGAGKSPVKSAIEIAIGVGVGLFVILLIAIVFCVLCICCTKRDVRTRYKEPRTDDLSIQQ